MKTKTLALCSLLIGLALYAVVNISLMNHNDSQIDKFLEDIPSTENHITE